jgi:lysozyme
MTINNIYSQLRRDEGVRPHAYNDIKGKITVGVGRNLTDKGLSESEIDFLLRNDIAELSEMLHARMPWYDLIGEARQGVILNMAFNLGFVGLELFPKFLQFVAHGDWDSAADEMKASAWAEQVGERAMRLEVQMRTGMWQ